MLATLTTMGTVFITGRLKEVINRGGEKVNPREVDEALLGHPAVAQAATFAMPHGTLGQDVAAALSCCILASSGTELEIRESVASQLAHFKVPARIFSSSRFPKGRPARCKETFSPTSWALPRPLATPPTGQAGVCRSADLARSLAGEVVERRYSALTALGETTISFILAATQFSARSLLLRVDSELGRRPVLRVVVRAASAGRHGHINRKRDA